MPKQSSLHVDQLLSNISVNYKPTGFVASDVFPFVPVNKETDLYRVYTQDFKVPETKRATGGLAKEHDFEVSTAPYILEKHALKGYVADDAEDNYDLSSLKADMTEKLKEKIMLRMEKSVADMMTTTTWSLGVSLASANAFTADTTVSNPIPVFDTACTTVLNNGGYKVNSAVIPRVSYTAIKNHMSVLDRVKHTSKDMTPEILKGLFDLDNIYVPHVASDTAAKGLAASISSLWASHCFVYYKPSRPGPMEASAGYIFKKNVAETRRWRVEERKAEAIEVEVQYAAKAVATLSAYLIKGAT